MLSVEGPRGSQRASYLVGGRVSKTGEEGQESTADGSIGSIPEDDLVQVRRRLDLADIAHEALGGGVDGVEDHELSETRTSWPLSDRFTRRWLLRAPAPTNRAVLDSLL